MCRSFVSVDAVHVIYVFGNVVSGGYVVVVLQLLLLLLFTLMVMLSLLTIL